MSAAALLSSASLPVVCIVACHVSRGIVVYKVICCLCKALLSLLSAIVCIMVLLSALMSVLLSALLFAAPLSESLLFAPLTQIACGTFSSGMEQLNGSTQPFLPSFLGNYPS
jgi:hypothetical protein